MDEKKVALQKVARFSDKEKTILFSLFKEYQDVIDIRYRRSSQSQHKQAELRKCWNTILETFNANSETIDRSMKQIQKFWLNSKLRNLLPSAEGSSKSLNATKKPAVKILNGTVSSPNAKTVDQKPIISTYQELATCHKAEVEEEEMDMNKSYEEEYESMPDAYLENNGESITFKVIDANDNNTLNYGLASSTTDQNIVAISSPTQVTGTIVTVPSTSVQTLTGAPTTYITYSQLKNTVGTNAIKVVKNDGSNIIISPEVEPIMLHTSARKEKRPSITSAALSISQPMINTTRSSAIPSASINSPQQTATSASLDEVTLKRSILQMQKEEMEYRLREAKTKCELQEIEKLKAKEELIQMREIHKMKIKEMELRLRNIERT